MLLFLSLLFLLFFRFVLALNWTATPINPPSLPLAVRSPYLSAWLPQGSAGTALNDGWAQFWTGNIVGWAGFVRVDSTAYSFLGAPGIPAAFQKATQISSTYTSTQTLFNFNAGPIRLSVTFFSPIEPTDLVKQSFPFSYLAVSAISTDGASHSVSIYTDISGEWLASNVSLPMNWTTSTGSVLTHRTQLQSQTEFAEGADRILQGSVYYSTLNSTGTTFQTGPDTVVRSQFVTTGGLNNTQDTNFRPIGTSWPVFAFAHNLGPVDGSISAPVVFSVGHVRDPVIKYIQNNGDTFQGRSYYFWSSYATVDAAISVFLEDYALALSRATTLDNKLQAAAGAVSNQYADIVALSMRQTFGATELTISGKPGAWNTNDVLMFIKEISSDGNLNTVDIIMPAWPAFAYTNPALCKYLLLPLLQYQKTGQYPNKYAVHDLGSTYPVANGHNLGKDEPMPIEESANMINMVLDYTQRTGDASLITSYSGLLSQWAGYLVNNTLFPANQLSTTDFAGALPNQTNLAIKGIIALKAMAVISTKYSKNAEIGEAYDQVAKDFLITWQMYGLSEDGTHLALEYRNSSTNVLAYNLAMDKLLGLNFIPDSVNALQSAYYANNMAKYGFPIDSRTNFTSSQWMIWASMTTSAEVRDAFINGIHNWLTSGSTSTPFGDRFMDDTGESSANKNRPVVGGNLALLLTNITSPSSTTTLATTTTSTATTSPLPTITTTPTDTDNPDGTFFPSSSDRSRLFSVKYLVSGLGLISWALL